jgi:predicted nucleic acid-binding protein
LLNTTLKPKIFCDANVLFGGARLLFRLAEFYVATILISPAVLSEAEQALRRKAPQALGPLALLLDAANTQVVDDAPWAEVEPWNELVSCEPDAGVVATAVAAQADYLVTLDRRHILSNKRLLQALPLVVGTPGDCLAWLRTTLVSPYQDPSRDASALDDHRLNEPLAMYHPTEAP